MYIYVCDITFFTIIFLLRFLLLTFFFLYSTTYITCPAEASKTLGIKLPFLVMIIKNMKKYFTFEVMVSNKLGTTHTSCYKFF